MSRALSDDLRQRVIEAVDGGMSCRGAARRFGIGEATANRWVRRWRWLGSGSADKRGSKSPRSPLAACHDELLALVGQRPGLTLNQSVVYLPAAGRSGRGMGGADVKARPRPVFRPAQDHI